MKDVLDAPETARVSVAPTAFVSPEMSIVSPSAKVGLNTKETVIVLVCALRRVLWVMVLIESAAWTFEKQQHNSRTKNAACQRKERFIIERLDWNVDRRRDTNRTVNDTIVDASAKMASETLSNPLVMSAVVGADGKVGSVAAAGCRVLAVFNAAENVSASHSWRG